VEDKIRDAIGQMGLALEESGFIRFGGLPITEFDDAKGTASVTIQWKPGKQFHIGRVEILGLEPEATQRLTEKYGWAPGSIFNGRAFTRFLESDDINLVFDPTQNKVLPSSHRARIDPSFDEANAIANLKIDFHQCP
jgi:hypothetical protein